MWKFFNRANLSQQDEREIRTLLASKEFEQIYLRAESEILDQRRALVKKLATLASRHDAGIETASNAVVAAAEKTRQAQAQLDAAKAAEKLAREEARRLETAKRADDFEIRKALTDGRDERLDDFWRIASSCRDKVRNLATVTGMRTERNVLGGRHTTYETNTEQVKAAMALIDEVQADLDRMALDAISRADVSEALTRHSHALAAALLPFDLEYPELDEHGDVKTSRLPVRFSDLIGDHASEKANAAARSADRRVIRP